MNTTDNGGFAFPGKHISYSEYVEGVGNRYVYLPHEGMTLRDYFAAKVMASQLAGQLTPYATYNYENAAISSYLMADAMLKVRNK